MPHKAITSKFVALRALTLALGIMISLGAANLKVLIDRNVVASCGTVESLTPDL